MSSRVTRSFETEMKLARIPFGCPVGFPANWGWREAPHSVVWVQWVDCRNEKCGIVYFWHDVALCEMCSQWLHAPELLWTQCSMNCCSVTKSCWLFATLWTAACQPPLSFTTPWVYSDSCLLSRWCYLTISSSAVLFSFCLQSFPAWEPFPLSRLFESGGSGIGASASASASVLTVYIQGRFPLGLTCLTPCSPRDSQEWSPVPQFISINSLVLSLLYGLALTSIHDYWKNHSFDYTDLCRQSGVSV